MSVWPTSLPQSPLLRGFSESGTSGTIRSEVDVGPAKTRRRYTAEVKTFDIELFMDDTQVALLETFYITTLGMGSLPFDWVDFRAVTILKSYRFVDRPAYTPKGSGFWVASFQIEAML